MQVNSNHFRQNNGRLLAELVWMWTKATLQRLLKNKRAKSMLRPEPLVLVIWIDHHQKLIHRAWFRHFRVQSKLGRLEVQFSETNLWREERPTKQSHFQPNKSTINTKWCWIFPTMCLIWWHQKSTWNRPWYQMYGLIESLRFRCSPVWLNTSAKWLQTI